MINMVNVGGDLVSVGQFYAAMYWGFVISTSFVGISLVQGFIYFTRANKDRWSMKALIISLLILDPATSLLTAETIYQYFVMNFGIMEALGKITISWVVENGVTVLVTAMVQVFLATRIYLVSNAVDALPLGRTAPALLFIFAIVAFVAGTVRTVLTGIPSEASSHVMFQILMTIEESSALLSDLLLSASLCYILGTPRLSSSMKRPETLKTIFMFIVNRAILISILQVGMLSSYLSAKDCLYWMPFHLCKSKLYTNTLLAMLNARGGGGYPSQTPPWPPWSMPIIDLATKDSEGMDRRSTFSTPERDVEKALSSEENMRPEGSLADLTSPGPS